MYLLQNISWKDNVVFPQETTISRAIVLASSGLDNGLQGCALIVPKNDSLVDWLDFMGYLEYLHERNNHGIQHQLF